MSQYLLIKIDDFTNSTKERDGKAYPGYPAESVWLRGAAIEDKEIKKTLEKLIYGRPGTYLIRQIIDKRLLARFLPGEKAYRYETVTKSIRCIVDALIEAGHLKIEAPKEP